MTRGRIPRITAPAKTDLVLLKVDPFFTTGFSRHMGSPVEDFFANIPSPVILTGDGRVQKEVVLSFDSIGKGATAPTLTRLGNTVGYAFTIGDDGYFSIEVPDDWAEGTDIGFFLHYYVDDAWVETTNEDEVQWQGLWSFIPEDGSEAVDGATHTGTLDSGDIAISTTTKGLQEVEVGSIPGGSLAQHDVLCVKLSRVALDGGTNPANEPVVIQAEIEYIADKLGIAT